MSNISTHDLYITQRDVRGNITTHSPMVIGNELTDEFIVVQIQIQIQFIELVARRLKIKKLNIQRCTVQQNNTRQEMKCNAERWKKIVESDIGLLVFYLFIHYATEAAQTHKIKHKVKTQSIKNSDSYEGESC